jgi:RHS repeat-associated protein
MSSRTDTAKNIVTTVKYTANNKPWEINKAAYGTNTGANITFAYDGAGRRIYKASRKTPGTPITTFYFGEEYEQTDGEDVYHLFGRGRVASFHLDGTAQFYHSDHLGSTSVVTNEQGNLVQQIGYYPFGNYLYTNNNQQPVVNYTFTGQEADDEIGLYNYNARLYDPVLGRFISADTIVPEPGNLQALNRYSYCLNNPLIYIDPSGNWSFRNFLNSIRPIVQVAAVVVSSYYMGPVGAVFASGGVNYAYTGEMKSSIIAGVQAGVTAGAFYGAGEYIDSLGGPGVAPLGARAGVHAVAGATAGGLNAAIGGGDIGLGTLVGGMSGGIGTYAGGYLPGEFASQLAGRALIGGVIGGVSAELYGGNFAQGFGEGAMTATSALLFNEMIHGQGKWVKHGPNWYDVHYDYSDADLKYLRYLAGEKNAQDLTNLCVIYDTVKQWILIYPPLYVTGREGDIIKH